MPIMPSHHPLPFCVSLTGADDAVHPQTLRSISETFAFAEWAILYFPEKEGSARNPSTAWRERFLATSPARSAAHLCGKRVFLELLDDELAPYRIDDLRRYGRVQLNINARGRLFNDEQVLKIYDRLLHAGMTLILQYHDESKDLIGLFLGGRSNEELHRIHVLFDGSKGRGVRPTEWPKPLTMPGLPMTCGYAGGLGPDVMTQEIVRIAGAVESSGSAYWVDMESGLRTNNQFDPDKAVEVLDAVLMFSQDS